MKPEYLRQMADKIDKEELWRMNPLEQMDLPPEKRWLLDAGVALRRHATHIQRLEDILKSGKAESLLITPLSSNSSAVKTVKTPAAHQKLRGKGW